MKTASDLFNEYYDKPCNERINSTLQNYVFDYQQAKIGELQLELSRTKQVLHNVIDIERTKKDELQGRIDEITNHVNINFDEDRDDDQHSYWSGYNQALRELNDILKGKEDETGLN